MQKKKEIRNWILIGESGCGKTELSLFLAKKKRKETGKTVHLIDMDQTKGMFRSRDFAEEMAKDGIEIISGAHFMDMPVVPHGVERLLSDEAVVNIMDVGGNEIGAVSLGQFSAFVNAAEAKVLYIINPYRNFSGTAENIKLLMEGIQNAGRVERISVICNPNVGEGTTAEDILNGYAALKERLQPLRLSAEALVLPDWVKEESVSQLSIPKWIITPYIKYP